LIKTIHNIINNTDEQLEFKISREENETINLDLSINRNTNNVDLNIYRKPTYIDIIMHSSSNHPYDHKLAAFKYYINRMITMPITEQAVKQERNTQNGLQQWILRTNKQTNNSHIKKQTNQQPKRVNHHKRSQCNNTIRDGSPSLIMAPLCIKSPVYLNTLI
jgi:hypothetical protein